MLTRRGFLLGSLFALAGADVLARRLLMSGSGSGGFTPPAPFVVSTITSAPEGGWLWFGSPRAISSGGQTIFGYINGDGDVTNRAWDESTHITGSITRLYPAFQVDDHEPPSFVVMPSGKIVAAFSYHVGEVYIAIGPSAGVLPAGAQVVNITSQLGAIGAGYGYSYASILYLEDEAKYYLFLRYHDSGIHPHVVFSTSTDCVTWTAHTVVQNITYHNVAKNGTGRLDLVTSDHPFYGQNDVSGAHTSVFHIYYDGTWHKSDGTGLSLPIANSGQATVVYDGTTSRGWLWDIAVNGSGYPVIVFVVYDETYPSGAWHYGYAVWSGSAWVVNDNIADAGSSIYNPAGSNDYAGGITIDPLNPNIVYYSSNAIGAAFQIYRAVTSDGGVSWAVTALTNDSNKNVRPMSVRSHDPALQVIWLTGTYTDYFTYSQGIRGAGV